MGRKKNRKRKRNRLHREKMAEAAFIKCHFQFTESAFMDMQELVRQSGMSPSEIEDCVKILEQEDLLIRSEDGSIKILR